MCGFLPVSALMVSAISGAVWCACQSMVVAIIKAPCKTRCFVQILGSSCPSREHTENTAAAKEAGAKGVSRNVLNSDERIWEGAEAVQFLTLTNSPCLSLRRRTSSSYEELEITRLNCER